MTDAISGVFVFIMGVVFVWLGLFRYEWLYKGIKDTERGRIDLLPFISNYWFWRVILVGIGILLVILTVNSLINNVFQ
ncbi:hypothetical protein NGI46_11165 [Peribacillus butanolivorans]|uniref:hypothetical protein n=1 Tax=Bacillaceae TaxID=186817 RepID=UPI00207C2995|nr:hypothetical protein [Peribacillus butanolivorans]MCO0598021.1 hypothetical protein [Peribacillus butanolivorans]